MPRTKKSATHEPPKHLSERSQQLWREVVPERISPGRLVTIQSALEALDRATGARDIIEREGLTVESERSGLSHLHPLLKVESEAASRFERLWLKLNLHFSGVDRFIGA